MSNVKETKEALIALNELSLHLIKIFKNGVSLSSAIELWELFRDDEELHGKLVAAYENYKLIPQEVESIDFMGTMDLVYTQLKYIPQIAETMRKYDVLLPAKAVPESLPVPDDVSDGSEVSQTVPGTKDPALGGAGDSRPFR